MKKDIKPEEDDLRPEYKRSDFTGPIVRGKYARALAESSNVVMLDPEVAEFFPNAEAVNSALKSLIVLAKKAASKKK